MLSIKIGDDILKYKVIPFLDILDCRNFNIAYHKFSIIINKCFNFGEFGRKFNSQNCLPSKVKMTEQQYYTINLHWKHDLLLIVYREYPLQNFKIKSTTQSLDIDYEYLKNECIENICRGIMNEDEYINRNQLTIGPNEECCINNIPNTLIKLDYYGIIVLTDINQFMGLRDLYVTKIDCNLSSLVNLTSLSVDKYTHSLPPNLIEYRCDILLIDQILPSKLEKLIVNTEIVYKWYTIYTKRNMVENFSIEDFPNNQYKNFKSLRKNEKIIMLPSTIKECYMLGPCIFSNLAVDEISVSINDDTILPLKCNKLNIYKININYPYKLNTQCKHLLISALWPSNFEPLVIFNQTFENVGIHVNTDCLQSLSNIRFINCKIDKVYLYRDLDNQTHHIFRNCEIQYLSLHSPHQLQFKLKNNKIKMLQITPTIENEYIKNIENMGYTYDNDTNIFNNRGGD